MRFENDQYETQGTITKKKKKKVLPFVYSIRINIFRPAYMFMKKKTIMQYYSLL